MYKRQGYEYEQYRYLRGADLEVGNIYPKEYARMAYEGMEAEGQQNIVNLLRCAWAGSQRYGALVWSGDIDSSFRSLRNQLTAGLNMGCLLYTSTGAAAWFRAAALMFINKERTWACEIYDCCKKKKRGISVHPAGFSVHADYSRISFGLQYYSQL